MKLSDIDTAVELKEQLARIELTLRQANKNVKDMAFDMRLRFPTSLALETLRLAKNLYQQQLRDLGVEA